mmetsp:Transcript_51519/g.142588  ORF Transcript_51519/g.142588 Transcript_51519/m.142588 type:complete len:250 (-) Transcript_51519:5100-5849(-)
MMTFRCPAPRDCRARKNLLSRLPHLAPVLARRVSTARWRLLSLCRVQVVTFVLPLRVLQLHALQDNMDLLWGSLLHQSVPLHRRGIGPAAEAPLPPCAVVHPSSAVALATDFRVWYQMGTSRRQLTPHRAIAPVQRLAPMDRIAVQASPSAAKLVSIRTLSWHQHNACRRPLARNAPSTVPPVQPQRPRFRRVYACPVGCSWPVAAAAVLLEPSFRPQMVLVSSALNSQTVAQAQEAANSAPRGDFLPT